jgi:hypothetical protein
VPHFRGLRHHLEEAFIEVRNIEIIPAITEGIFRNDVVRRGIEKNLKIQRNMVRGMLFESTKDFP